LCCTEYMFKAPKMIHILTKKIKNIIKINT